MSASIDSCVLVEGFDDRAFWKGLLFHFGCEEARGGPASPHREQATFSYLTPKKTLIHVVPYKAPTPKNPGGLELAEIVRAKLAMRKARPLVRLIISPDADLHPTLDDAHKGVRSLVVESCADVKETEDGDFMIDGGPLVVSTLFLHAEVPRDPEGELAPGIPEQPAVEQLVCAAIAEAYPSRAEAVARWLKDRPSPTGKLHKAHAWSHYAGWFTSHGTGDFYSALWRDGRVAEALLGLLKQQGALRIIEALVR